MTIAIIVILMSLLLPVFAGAIKKAKNVGRPMDSNDPDSQRVGPSSIPHESILVAVLTGEDSRPCRPTNGIGAE